MSEQNQWNPKTLQDRLLCRTLGIVTPGMAKTASEKPINPVLVNAALRINAVRSSYGLKKTAGARLMAGLVMGDELMVKVAALGLQMKQAREAAEKAKTEQPKTEQPKAEQPAK